MNWLKKFFTRAPAAVVSTADDEHLADAEVQRELGANARRHREAAQAALAPMLRELERPERMLRAALKDARGALAREQKIWAEFERRLDYIERGLGKPKEGEDGREEGHLDRGPEVRHGETEG